MSGSTTLTAAGRRSAKSGSARPKPSRRRSLASLALSARVDQLLARKIECIPIPEFARPEAVAEFLGPPPEGISEVVEAPAGTPPYLASLYAIPLLTREQEHHQFRKMHVLLWQAKQLQDRLRKGRATPALVQQLEDRLRAANDVRNAIVQANLRLVVSVAKTVVDPCNTLDDLISDGNVPLIRAVEIFDYTRGLRFSTYATWAVRNCLFRTSPRNRRLARRFACGAAEFLAEVADLRPDAHADEAETARRERSVRQLLDGLPPRDRAIVEARFGLGADERANKFREIASRLQISNERVRQLLARALQRLRRTAADDASEWW